MPELIFQGDVAIVMQGPGDGVLQPTLDAAAPGDADSLDAGIWPSDGSGTWAAGPFAQDVSYFPASQYCQLLPTGYSIWNFTDSAAAISTNSAAAVVFQGHVYSFAYGADNLLLFLDYALPAGPTNAAATKANVPFTHLFGPAPGPIDSRGGMFTLASGIGLMALGALLISSSGSFLVLYPDMTSVTLVNPITSTFGVNPQNSPDFQTGLNYTSVADTPRMLSTWSISNGAAAVSVPPTAITWDAHLTARGGITDIKPCVFGWFITINPLDGIANKDTKTILCSRDLTKYWTLTLTASPLSSGYSFGEGNFGLQIDAGGFLYVFSPAGELFATATSQLGVLPLSPSLPFVSIPADGVPVSDGSDPQLIMQISNDGGNTWSSERSGSMGKIGQYRRLMRFRQGGRSNNRVYRVICSEPVDASLITADLETA